MGAIVQKLKKGCVDGYQQAETYFAIMSALNNLKLTQREIQLVGFTAIHGNISHSHIKEEFCEKHDTSIPTINNIISRLKRIDVFIKDKGKIKVNPVFILKFEDDVVLQISLMYGR